MGGFIKGVSINYKLNLRAKKLLLFFYLFLSFAFPKLWLSADTSIPLTIPFTSAPPKIDGNLNDTVWQISPIYNMFEAMKGERAHLNTSVRMLYDKNNLYFSFDVFDTAIYAKRTNHDDKIYEEDAVEIFIKIPGGEDTGPYIEIEINPLNTVYDAFMSDCTKIDFPEVLKWNPENLITKTKKSKIRWQVEGSLAWSNISNSVKPGDIIYLNAVRIERTDAKSDYQYFALSPTFGWFHQLQYFMPFLLEFPKPVKETFTKNLSNLLVVIIADQFRYDYLTTLSPYLSETGFFKSISNYGRKIKGVYRSMPTHTAPGHSSIFTGYLPSQTAIVSDMWLDRKISKFVNPVADTYYTITETNEVGCSPRYLMKQNFSDILKSISPSSKIFSISLKDYASVLSVGKSGLPIWYESKSGKWVTSNYYAKQTPNWLEDFQKKNPVSELFKKKWDALKNYNDIAVATADNRKLEDTYFELPNTFPKLLIGKDRTKPDETFYKTLIITPYMTDYTLNLAKKIIKEEKLGADEYTDLLIISLSALDYAGHNYGPYSWEVLDHIFRMDASLEKFLKFIEKQTNGKFSLIFTSDHGCTPFPEEIKGGGRVQSKLIKEKIEEIIGTKWEQGNWIRAYQFPYFYINDKLAKEKNLSIIEIADYVCDKFQMPGVRKIIALPCAINNSSIWNGYYEGRSGDIIVELDAYYYYTNSGTGHYSSYQYDIEVPVGFYNFDKKILDQLPALIWMDQLFGYIYSIDK